MIYASPARASSCPAASEDDPTGAGADASHPHAGAAPAGDEPEAEAQAAAHSELVDSDVTLPEEDITRDED